LKLKITKNLKLIDKNSQLKCLGKKQVLLKYFKFQILKRVLFFSKRIILKAGKLSQVVSKVIHNPLMKTNIPAGMASSTPPLGTMLGQVRPIISSLISKCLKIINLKF